MAAEHVIVTSTTDSEAAARELAAQAVAARLGACAQVVGPITSVYRWEGAVRTDQEWRVEIKTTADRVPALTARLRQLHGYDLPEVIATPIVGGSAEYLAWLTGETRDAGWIRRMDHEGLRQRFATLTTAHLADACIRAGLPVRCAPAPTRAVVPGSRLFGPAVPARHVGSVDVFLEAFEDAPEGGVLVVDNGGRLDESCVGDLVVLEARAAGLSGVVIWGLHRDTADIRAIGLPVFSLGSLPTGPLSLGPRVDGGLAEAIVGTWRIGPPDLVLGDDDGVLFVPLARAGELFTLAEGIRDTERRQADRIRGGEPLRQQVRFGEFLAARETDPSLTFRAHLRAVGGAIEE